MENETKNVVKDTFEKIEKIAETTLTNGESENVGESIVSNAELSPDSGGMGRDLCSETGLGISDGGISTNVDESINKEFKTETTPVPEQTNQPQDQNPTKEIIIDKIVTDKINNDSANDGTEPVVEGDEGDDLNKTNLDILNELSGENKSDSDLNKTNLDILNELSNKADSDSDSVSVEDNLLEQIINLIKTANYYSYISCGRFLKNEINKEQLTNFLKEFKFESSSNKNDSILIMLIELYIAQ